jgi:hypothetical protein
MRKPNSVALAIVGAATAIAATAASTNFLMFLSSRCCERGENECRGPQFLEHRRNFFEWMFTIMACLRKRGATANDEKQKSAPHQRRAWQTN